MARSLALLSKLLVALRLYVGDPPLGSLDIDDLEEKNEERRAGSGRGRRRRPPP
jgi:hypothetical protein